MRRQDDYVGGKNVTARRDNMFKDGFRAMHDMSAVALKGRLRLTFINEHGEQEAGIDGGGLFKDFMEHLIKVCCQCQALHPLHGTDQSA